MKPEKEDLLERYSTAATHECTSWVVMPELTGGKYMLLHKNRDSKVKKICLNQAAPAGKNSWIALGSPGGSANIGINSRGVAIVMNSGDLSDGQSKEPALSTSKMAAVALEACASAAEAVDLIRDLVRDRKYQHGERGSIWFFADPKRAFVAENDLLRFAVHEVESGFAIRANVWHYPEMLIYSASSPAEHIKNLRRECAVLDHLFGRGTAYAGPVTVEKIAEASRIDLIPEAPECYPLCGCLTNSAGTIAIDCEYPEMLSTLYAAFGPPRHAAYLPIPAVQTELPEPLLEVAFADAAFARYDAKRDLLPIDELIAFELKLNQRHCSAVEEAREKLKNGGTRQEVRKILSSAFRHNWEELRELCEGR